MFYFEIIFSESIFYNNYDHVTPYFFIPQYKFQKCSANFYGNSVWQNVEKF